MAAFSGIRKSILLFFLFMITGLCSFGQVSNKHSNYLNDIQDGDSLTLLGYFSDCGEWGGHFESIYVYRKDSALWFTYKKDSIHCPRYANHEQIEMLEVSKPLTAKQKKIIQNYLDGFSKFNKSIETNKYKTISNGPNCYNIITKDRNIEVCDHNRKWVLFKNTVIELLR
ncbi:MAG: hypothetical protein CFE21_05945 [Bacteroidetes bacterium B1(2017)]|nr:MAG: hypothetical protein CFE21_05945 [Bacteroidetes bacterium B1(2017)]